MKERLVLVTDFAELRAGMIVVIKPCGYCGRVHRTMLTRSDIGGYWRSNGAQEAGKRWWNLPEIWCAGGLSKPLVVTAAGVEGRILYRVLDGLEDTDTTTHHTRKPTRTPALAGRADAPPPPVTPGGAEGR